MKLRQLLVISVTAVVCALFGARSGVAIADDSISPLSGVVGMSKDSGGSNGIVGSGATAPKDPPQAEALDFGSAQADSVNAQFGLQGCGFECTYLKANENLALQAMYIARQMDLLEKPENEGSRADYLNSMNFCEKSESTEGCYQRFRRMNLAALRKIKQYMAENNANAAKLQGDGSSGGAAFEMQKKKGLAPVTPYVYTWADVRNEFKRLRNLTSDDYRKWQASFGPGIYKPDKADFAKFVEVQRDPKHPELGKFKIISKRPDGTIDYDETKFALAKKRYDEQTAIKNADLMGAYREADDYKKIQDNESATVGARVEPVRLHFLQRQAFSEARGNAVEMINSAFQGGDESSATLKMKPGNTGLGEPQVRLPAGSESDGDGSITNRSVQFNPEDMDTLILGSGGYNNDAETSDQYVPGGIEHMRERWKLRARERKHPHPDEGEGRKVEVFVTP